MADDLLGLELESMAFSQRTQLSDVLRVPYKGVTDSQTVQTRASHELEYKDPCRSNPDSALLDLTRPALTGAPSSLEIVWDDDLMLERQSSPFSYTSLPYP